MPHTAFESERENRVDMQLHDPPVITELYYFSWQCMEM